MHFYLVSRVFQKTFFFYINGAKTLYKRYIQSDSFFFWEGGGGGVGVSYRDDSVTYVLICFPRSKVPKCNFAPSLD